MIESLPTSIQKIIAFFHSETNLTPAMIEKAIQDADVKAQDLMPWADYEHPAEDGYGRKMVFKGDSFEIMVMSWNPGDFSGIHDHGYTQFGAVQLFGEADHAIFRIEDDLMKTVARWMTQEGDTIPVNHDLIHQMGNPGHIPYLTLHVYGTEVQTHFVTGEARLYDLERKVIQRSNGGVFFGLTEEEVERQEPGYSGDFITRFRYLTEWCFQALKGGKELSDIHLQLNEVTHPRNKQLLLDHLNQFLDTETGKVTNQKDWISLQLELKALARLQEKIREKNEKSDPFDEYAPLYDAIIGHNSLDFQKRYLSFFSEICDFDLKKAGILSVGCGTGLVEEWITDHINPEGELVGFDIAESMVAVANSRIVAEQKDVLAYQTDQPWDVVFTGLNVYQYLGLEDFEKAVRKSAEITKKGGYFVGDFITPDHIRWYPNVMYSENKDVMSFRSPRIIESEPYNIQESEIINISFLTREMYAFYAGKHRRILPSIKNVAELFETHFGTVPSLHDAVTLKAIEHDDETCESTRYLVIVKKEKDR
jgi:SAM-dependent methyltransferase/predicted metal-dependent enzyme (double-stranded beta helix superfamily)